MDRRAHWEEVYRRRPATSVSWYRPHLELSIALIERVAESKRAAILDIGGGASTLVDDLLAAGYEDISVLDVAEPALEVAQQRLGERRKDVTWLMADFLEANLDLQRYDVCHDRAVFHFLNAVEDRTRYFEQAERILRPHGTLVLATFALDGPERCSGLDVSRYDEAALRDAAVAGFELMESRRVSHRTPAGQTQEMMYFVLRRSALSPASG
ncbi:class I SAM-dependent methyltransferase [Edaphobacter bradus]|uniref:class I SAM-dependent methyltransferase n=1 Tax=Edaphobacter bradus TaxID=2259016 RepID=UPI0021E047D1|nr:class I SAM-dependent methyltransferase [Edaphobacter bradus]